MPNWCVNIVKVSGERAEIGRFADFVESKYEPFSFESICPIPKELYDVQSPVTIKTQEEIDVHKGKYKNGSGFPITQETYDRLMNEHGCANWYDWACDNWGTKWDIRDVELTDDLEELQYRFDTAWGPPKEIYYLLVKKFPDLHIAWFFDEPGMEIAGYLHV